MLYKKSTKKVRTQKSEKLKKNRFFKRIGRKCKLISYKYKSVLNKIMNTHKECIT